MTTWINFGRNDDGSAEYNGEFVPALDSIKIYLNGHELFDKTVCVYDTNISGCSHNGYWYQVYWLPKKNKFILLNMQTGLLFDIIVSDIKPNNVVPISIPDPEKSRDFLLTKW